MSTTNEARDFVLHERAREVLGEQEGDRLMSRLLPVAWYDLATKDDIAHLSDRIDVLGERIDVLGERMDGMGERMDGMGERMDGMVTKAEFERGMRRQTVWMASLVIGQSTFYAGMTFWLAGQLSG